MTTPVRFLVTGFTPFPGAPVNPTEHLIRHFEANPPLADEAVEFRFAVLPVDYGATIPALEQAVDGFDPHVAVHFGLAGEASGFRFETLARNEVAARIPDNAGFQPERSMIRPDAGHAPSTLPLTGMAEALRSRGMVVEWSEDAGGYLCNYVFYHSAAGLCRGLDAAMAGFVHVGPVRLPGAAAADAAMDFDALVRGAEIILETCVRSFRGEDE